MTTTTQYGTISEMESISFVDVFYSLLLNFNAFIINCNIFTLFIPTGKETASLNNRPVYSSYADNILAQTYSTNTQTRPTFSFQLSTS